VDRGRLASRARAWFPAVELLPYDEERPHAARPLGLRGACLQCQRPYGCRLPRRSCSRAGISIKRSCCPRPRTGTMCYCLWYYLPLSLVLCAIVSGTMCHCLWYYLPLSLVLCAIISGTICYCLWYYVPLSLVLFAIVSGAISHCLWYHLLLSLVPCDIVSGTMCLCLWYYLPLSLVLPCFTSDAPRFQNNSIIYENNGQKRTLIRASRPT